MKAQPTTWRHPKGNGQVFFVTWTPAKMRRLQRAVAGKHKDAVIIFDGKEFLVSYARYVIELLQQDFNRRRK